MNERFPIVVRPTQEGTVFLILISGFFCLVLFLLSLVMGCAVCCAVAGILMLSAVWASFLRSKAEVRFEVTQVIEVTAFAKNSFPYDGMEFILRRSRRDGRWAGASGAAICLSKWGRTQIWIPLHWGRTPELEQAIRFLSRLPNKKRYL